MPAGRVGVKSPTLKRAVFLDRDGTLIKERGYLKNPNRIRFYSSVVPALRRLKRAGLVLVVVTNQSGIGRGYFPRAVLRKIHRIIHDKLRKTGVTLSGIYYCPHAPDDACSCRKPKPGLPRRAAKALGLNLKKSFVVGDQWRDMELAKRIGAKGVLVLTGAGRGVARTYPTTATKVCRDLNSAGRWIEGEIKR